MKKLFSVMLVTMLCSCCLALAACGGGASTSPSASVSSSEASNNSVTSASGSTAAANSVTSASSTAANSTDQYIGDWKLAAAKTGGVTIVGDFSSGILGTKADMTISLAEGGKGTISLNEDSSEISWEVTGPNTISITPSEKLENAQKFDATYNDGALSVEMSDDSFSGEFLLSKDGTVQGIEPLSLADAKDITSADAVVGTWKLSGANMAGLSMYGEADDLATAFGGSGDTTMTLKEDGTGTSMGDAVTWSINSTGASIDLGNGTSGPMKMLDGNLVIDASSILGVELALVFSK